MGRLKPLFIVINGQTGFHNIIQIAQIAPIRLGNLGLDLLSLQCFLPATLNCYFSTHSHTSYLKHCLTKSLFLQSVKKI